MIVLKLDLRNEALSADGYGVALVFLNVGVPLGLLIYYCVPTLVDRSTLGDAGRARQVFELLDVDGVGFVTRDQVRQLLQATHGILAGDAVTEDELDRSFASTTDQTSNGQTTVRPPPPPHTHTRDTTARWKATLFAVERVERGSRQPLPVGLASSPDKVTTIRAVQCTLRPTTMTIVPVPVHDNFAGQRRRVACLRAAHLQHERRARGPFLLIRDPTDNVMESWPRSSQSLARWHCCTLVHSLALYILGVGMPPALTQ